MLRFVVRRLLLLVPILLGVSLLVFGWIRALPGSPAEALLGEHATPHAIQQIRHQYGLDKPIPVQYWNYVKTLTHGNLGTSITTQRTITYEIGHRFPATVELALAAMFLSILGGIPIFFLGLILKWIFAVKLGWLPSIGREDVLATRPHPTNFYLLDALLNGDAGAFWDALKHLILPAVALGSIPLAIVARITRAAVLDVQNEDYVRTARAKGVAPIIVDSRHVLRNALLPVSTIIGLQTGLLLSGAVLTETIFAWPGVGSWLKDAIFNRDYPVLQGGILFLAVVFVVVNLIVDISYAIINPRIRLS